MTDALGRPAFAMLCLALTACQVPIAAGRPSHPSRRDMVVPGDLTQRCTRHDLGPESPYRVQLEEAPTDPALVGYLERVPSDVRRTLVAGGLASTLARFMKAKDEANGATSAQMLSLRQDLYEQLHLFETQLSAVLYEVDCTGDQVEELGRTLERKRDHRELALTISSLVVGAGVAAAAGIWDLRDEESKGPAVTGIVGGAATGALGVAAFIPRHVAVHYEHPRNLLAPLVQGNDPQHVYPTAVFRLLSMADEGTSPSARMTTHFHGLVRAEVEPALQGVAEAILFGRGGTYDESLLKVRERIYDEVESEVRALYRDLELLERYLAQESTERGS